MLSILVLTQLVAAMVSAWTLPLSGNRIPPSRMTLIAESSLANGRLPSLRRSAPPSEISSQQQSSTWETRTFAIEESILTYRFKPASPECQNESPIFLIHPVGIGLSSWFYERLFEDSSPTPAMYALNLPGCGVSDGSFVWPKDRSWDLPDDWVVPCETFIRKVVLQNQAVAANPFSKLISFPSPVSSPRKASVTVLAQGGLAPIAVLLAHRNPSLVGNVVLTSPPTWKDMTTAVPSKEVEANYDFFTSSIRGGLAFFVLEQQWAIEFFSNLFLFQKPCDATWLTRTQQEACLDVRPPVQAFNSGLLMAQSYESELRTLTQPMLILQGVGDKARHDQREAFVEQMKNCVIMTLEDSKNVLPWEVPGEVMAQIRRFTKR